MLQVAVGRQLTSLTVAILSFVFQHSLVSNFDTNKDNKLPRKSSLFQTETPPEEATTLTYLIMMILHAQVRVRHDPARSDVEATERHQQEAAQVLAGVQPLEGARARHPHILPGAQVLPPPHREFAVLPVTRSVLQPLQNNSCRISLHFDLVVF